jgi:hypothetical protein
MTSSSGEPWPVKYPDKNKLEWSTEPKLVSKRPAEGDDDDWLESDVEAAWTGDTPLPACPVCRLHGLPLSVSEDYRRFPKLRIGEETHHEAILSDEGHRIFATIYREMCVCVLGESRPEVFKSWEEDFDVRSHPTSLRMQRVERDAQGRRSFSETHRQNLQGLEGHSAMGSEPANILKKYSLH